MKILICANMTPASGHTLNRLASELTSSAVRLFALGVEPKQLKPEFQHKDGCGVDILIDARQLSAGTENDPASRVLEEISTVLPPHIEVTIEVVSAEGCFVSSRSFEKEFV